MAWSEKKKLDRIIELIESDIQTIEEQHDGRSIDPRIAAKLIDYAKLFVAIDKAHRESIEELKLDRMSDDDLRAKARKFIEGKFDDPDPAEAGPKVTQKREPGAVGLQKFRGGNVSARRK